MPPSSPRSSGHRVALAATLRQSHLFSGLSTGDLEAVTDVCSLRTLAKGEALFREGERSEGFYVMHAGSVSIYRLTRDGREQIICVFRAPDSFGEATLANLEVYPANAVALESSQVIQVSKVGFRALIRRNPDMSLHMLGAMSMHLRHLVESLQGMKGRQIENRLAEWLLLQGPNAAEDGPTEIELSMTKKVLAGQLGVTSETLSRTFARFRAEKLITVDGPRIRLIDSLGLQRHAGG